MKIETQTEGSVTLLRIEGVIKLGESAETFSAHLERLLQAGSGCVLIDMAAIDHVDSTGLGELVGYLERFSKQGRRLALLRPHQRVLKLLELTDLHTIIPIFDDRRAAIEALHDA